MPRSVIWSPEGMRLGHIDTPDAPRPDPVPRPDGPPGPPLGPIATLLLFLMSLAMLVGMVVMVIGAVNAPNPGDPGYVRPGSSQSAPPLDPPTDWTVPQ